MEPLVLESVTPDTVPGGTAPEVVIAGKNFEISISRHLNGSPEFVENEDVEVAVRRKDGVGGGYHILESAQIVDGEHLRAQLPSGLNPGGYMLRVTDAIGRTDELTNAFEVMADQDTAVVTTEGDSDTAETATDTEGAPGSSDMASEDEGASDTDIGRDSDLEQDTSTGIPSDTGQQEATDTVFGSDVSTESVLSTDSATGAEEPTDSDTGVTDGFRGDGCDSFLANSLLCDGFESDLGYTIWYYDGTIAIIDTMAHSGDSSLYAVSNEQGAYANIATEFSPVFEGSVYFRAFYYIPTGTVTGTVKIADIRGGNDRMMLDINIMTQGRIMVYHHGDGSRDQSEPGAYDEGEWFCLNGFVDIDNTAGSITVSVGDTEVLVRSALDTLPNTGIMAADFGIGWTEDGQQTAELYVDDIAVDVAPIGCQ